MRAMQSYSRIENDLADDLVPFVAPTAGRLVLAAVEVSDLLYMGKDCGNDAVITRPTRQAAATPVFIDAMTTLMRRIQNK
jgi:hypothetical protein